MLTPSSLEGVVWCRVDRWEVRSDVHFLLFVASLWENPTVRGAPYTLTQTKKNYVSLSNISAEYVFNRR